MNADNKKFLFIILYLSQNRIPLSLQIIEATSASQLKQFANLPFTLYKGNRYWVPSMKKDELKALMPSTNPAFNFCEAKFWLAIKDGKVVGRIAGIINNLEIEKTGIKQARFSRFECINDIEVAKALLNSAEKWAIDKKMISIHGPLGFTNLDHQGVLVEGFDHIPSIASEYHHEYYQKLIESCGYEKEMDWVEFRLTIESIPEKAQRLNAMIQERYKLKVIKFKTQDEMKPYGKKAFDLLNEAFSDLFSMVPLNEKMQEYYINRYFNFLNPKFVIMIEDEEKKIVGFIIGLPSLSEAMQKAGGSLFPFGWYHITQALKKPKVVDLMLTAVHPKMQAQGVPAILITELQQIMIDHGVQYAETTGIIESNTKAIQVWKNYNHIQHKRKRAYKKSL
jgi:GNAT superfamily N-acetyltransferase